MFIDDYIEKVSLQEELKNVKEQLKKKMQELKDIIKDLGSKLYK